MLSPTPSDRPSSRASGKAMVNYQSSTIKVVVRVRPVAPAESRRSGGRTEVEKAVQPFMSSNTVVLPSINQRFFFDHVYDDTIDQEQLYTSSIKTMVSTFLNGFNVTVLAYGQTSSGKTYTMGTSGLTDSESDGIIPRAMRSIFESASTSVDEEGPPKFDLYVSYLELYNEELIDLLSDGSSKEKSEIVIREEKNGRIIWSGASEVLVNSPDDVWKLLVDGSKRRQVASTEMNSVSSRSHAIFSVSLVQTKVNKHNIESKSKSKFHFVDLAGSERMKKTGASGDRAKEGIKINSGLSALGNVISALASPAKKQHIPFRNSKLTRLLQDSIGGNSYTIMIACISPTQFDIHESHNTLMYASRARNIKNKVVQAAEEVTDVNSLKQTIRKLEDELESYKNGTTPTTPISPVSAQSPAMPDARTFFLLKKNQSLESDLASLRKKYSALQFKMTQRPQSSLSREDSIPHIDGVSVFSDNTARDDFNERIQPIIFDYERVIREADDEVLELTNKNREVVKQLQLAKTQIVSAQAKEEAMKNAFVDLKTKIQDLRAENEVLSGSVHSLSRPVSSMLLIADVSSERSSDDTSPEAQLERLSLLEAQFQSIYEDRNKLQSKLQKTESKNLELKKDVATLSNSLALVTSEAVYPGKRHDLNPLEGFEASRDMSNDSNFTNGTMSTPKASAITKGLSEEKSDLASNEELIAYCAQLQSDLSNSIQVQAQKDLAIAKLKTQLESSQNIVSTENRGIDKLSSNLKDEESVDFPFKLNLLQTELLEKENIVKQFEIQHAKLSEEHQQVSKFLTDMEAELVEAKNLHAQQISELEEKVNGLGKSRDIDLSSHQESLSNMNEQTKANEDSLNDLQYELENHKSHVDKLTARLNEKNQLIQTLQAKLDLTKTQASSNHAELIQVIKEVPILQTKLEETEKDLVKVKEHAEVVVSEKHVVLDDSKQIIERLSYEIESLESLLAVKNAEIDGFKAKEADLDQKITTLISQVEETKLALEKEESASSSLKFEVENFKLTDEQLKQVSQDLIEKNAKAKALQEKQADLADKVTQQNEEISQLTSQLEEAKQSSLLALKDEISVSESLQQELLDHKNSLDLLNQEKQELLSNLEDTKAKVTQKEDEIDRLTTNLSDANAQIKGALTSADLENTKAYEQLTETIKDLEDQIEDLTSEIDTLCKVGAEDKAEVEKLTHQIKEKDDNFSHISAELSESKATIESLKSQIEEKRSQLSSVTIERQVVTDKKDQASHELNSKILFLEEAREALGKELTKTIKEIDTYKKLTNELNASQTNLSSQLVSKEEDLANMEATINAIRDDLQEKIELIVQMEQSQADSLGRQSTITSSTTTYQGELLADNQRLEAEVDKYKALSKEHQELSDIFEDQAKNLEDLKNQLQAEIQTLKSLLSENESRLTQVQQSFKEEKKQLKAECEQAFRDRDDALDRASKFRHQIRVMGHDAESNSSNYDLSRGSPPSQSPNNSLTGTRKSTLTRYSNIFTSPIAAWLFVFIVAIFLNNLLPTSFSLFLG